MARGSLWAPLYLVSHSDSRNLDLYSCSSPAADVTFDASFHLLTSLYAHLYCKVCTTWPLPVLAFHGSKLTIIFNPTALFFG